MVLGLQVSGFYSTTKRPHVFRNIAQNERPAVYGLHITKNKMCELCNVFTANRVKWNSIHFAC